ncbi:hypothetical protein Glo7428_4938 (plasmid) [Gloeocapsa sp. PCC 7428]|uniref:hypothetical protein n=1 Tax=Gloeocapsa sp. PCC 7428 TaxID=1173026 RepID=UPI0002A5F740|nr:hypothetical protein [Gloeocapsa sp. PCC 7428]AFZ33350.1 hypothetical protein Glo7428_4938 [Gloeocapsa sp. PCC 7428]
MSKYVNTSEQIPKDALNKIKARLIQQIDSMSEAELKIATKSEADLKYFISDLFRSIAQLFGYTVGAVVGIVDEVGRGIKRGWNDGFNAGRGK